MRSPNQAPVLPAAASLVTTFLLALASGGAALGDPIPVPPAGEGASVREYQPEIQFSGRVNAVAIHPEDVDVVYATTESGGLWKTVDGHRWRHVDSLPVFLTNDVAVHPGDPDLVIVTSRSDFRRFEIGTGPDPVAASGGGIWISRDGGSTWDHPADTIPRAKHTFLNELRCPPDLSAFGIDIQPDSNAILVATDCGLSISDDLAETWRHEEIPYGRSPTDSGRTAFKSVAALGDGRIVLGGHSGVWIREGAGETWEREQTGIGTVTDIHAVSASPRDGEVFAVESSRDEAKLYRSGNGGRTWDLIEDTPTPVRDNCGGIAFVRAAEAEKRSLLFTRRGLDVYYGNRCHSYRIITTRPITGGQLPFDEGWERLEATHADARDVGLHQTGITGSGIGTFSAVEPLFLANDGGLDTLGADGETWAGVGSGPGGINALQIMDVAGQRIGSARYDLVFGSQDNLLWASPDAGASWPAHRGAEGFAIELERRVASVDRSRMTYRAGVPMINYVSKPLFEEESRWPNPIFDERQSNSPPRLVRKDVWFQNWGPGPGRPSANRRVSRGIDRGSDWTSIIEIPESMNGVPRIVATREANIAYQAVRTGSSFEPLYDARFAFPKIELARISNPVLSETSSKRYPDMDGFGSLGVVPTMWVWDVTLAVDPQDPMHLIAADAQNERMGESWDGGQTWSAMESLTEQITRGGRYAFTMRHKRFHTYLTLVSEITFHPEDPNLVLLGTRQAGLFLSRDRGETWTRVPDSEQVTNVTSAHWISLNNAVVATYGRGLWEVRLVAESELPHILADCPDCLLHPVPAGSGEPPIPLGQLGGNPSNRFSSAALMFDGHIVDAGQAGQDPLEPTLPIGSSIVFYREPQQQGEFLASSEGLRAGEHRLADLLDETVAASALPPKEADPLVRGNGEAGNPGDHLRVLRRSLPGEGLVVGVAALDGKLTGLITRGQEVSLQGPGALVPFENTGRLSSGFEQRPYVTLSARNYAAGSPVLGPGAKTLFVEGRNFDPDRPLEVLIDGNPSQITPKFRDDGVLEALTRPDVPVGRHTLTVRQYDAHQQLHAASAAFFVRHVDEEVDQTR